MKWSGMGLNIGKGEMNWREGTKKRQVITSEWNWNFRAAAPSFFCLTFGNDDDDNVDVDGNADIWIHYL